MVCQIHRNKEADNKDDATITVLGRRGLTCGGGRWSKATRLIGLNCYRKKTAVKLVCRTKNNKAVFENYNELLGC